MPSPFVYRCGETGALGSKIASSDRPLALCLGWSNASVRSLSKYAEVYARHGNCDAVLLPSTPRLVYSPEAGSAATKALADALDKGPPRPLIVCGFSVGAYLYANFLMHLREAGHIKIEERLKGIIFDSPVDWYGVPRGLSRSIVGSDGTFTQKTLESAIHGYLQLFQSVSQRYKIASDFLHNHDLNVPSLWLFSTDDFVVPSDDIRKVITKWQAKGHRVTPIQFTGSKHVMHLPTHTHVYDQAVKTFFHDSLLREDKV